MKRVVTVSLHGISIHFDEDAYDALRSYMERAEAQLARDPGRIEVLADLERSVAEKCQRFLNAQKNVISLAEIREVLNQIGGVAGTTEESGTEPAAGFNQAATTRQLVQVREGAMISGVCNGLAVYLGIDVTLLRVIFVLLAIASSGAFVLIYGAMMFLIPYDTNIEKVNDQSIPGFMFKFVTHTKRKLAGSS